MAFFAGEGKENRKRAFRDHLFLPPGARKSCTADQGKEKYGCTIVASLSGFEEQNLGPFPKPQIIEQCAEYRLIWQAHCHLIRRPTGCAVPAVFRCLPKALPWLKSDVPKNVWWHVFCTVPTSRHPQSCLSCGGVWSGSVGEGREDMLWGCQHQVMKSP